MSIVGEYFCSRARTFVGFTGKIYFAFQVQVLPHVFPVVSVQLENKEKVPWSRHCDKIRQPKNSRTFLEQIKHSQVFSIHAKTYGNKSIHGHRMHTAILSPLFLRHKTDPCPALRQLERERIRLYQVPDHSTQHVKIAGFFKALFFIVKKSSYQKCQRSLTTLVLDRVMSLLAFFKKALKIVLFSLLHFFKI
mgnify:CR=1 FL=1